VFCHRYSFASLRTGSTAACVVRKTGTAAQVARTLTGCEACGRMYPASGGRQRNREKTLGLPAPGGQGLGWRGMVNPGELPINVVMENKPKVLFSPTRTLGLGQKARGQI
jgi:hypothetical protein